MAPAARPGAHEGELDMIPKAFDYYAPASLKEAAKLLSRYGADAKLLAGGHSLIPLMKLRLAAPRYLIDLGRIPDLVYIKEIKGKIAIGAMTTYYNLESSELLAEKCPLLREAASVIGDVQVRNKGTIGGSLSHADPAADLPAAVLALDAELKTISAGGQRSIEARDFFVDMLTTALRQDEILAEIRVPVMPARSGAAYEKLPQKASGFAIVGVAAQITLDAKGNCREARVALTGVGTKPFRAARTEEALAGKKVDEKLIAEASALAADGIEPLEDIHASAEYRAEMARVYTRRALLRALVQATGR